MDESKAPDINTLLADLTALHEFIDEKATALAKTKAKDDYESEETAEICAALAKAQGAFPKIDTNRANNFLFNQYSDLDIIMRSIRPALKENGLSITQQTKIYDDKTLLVSRVRHESSQFIETRVRIIPSKNDIQSYASALKAMKRHAIMALLNITIKDDLDDDDGEHDMQSVRKERNAGLGVNTRYEAKKESFHSISQHESNELQYILSNYPDIAEQILDTLKVESIADIPKSKFAKVREQAQKIINAREGKVKC